MAYEVELSNNQTGQIETLILTSCTSIDDCIQLVHTERPNETIEFIGVSV